MLKSFSYSRTYEIANIGNVSYLSDIAESFLYDNIFFFLSVTTYKMPVIRSCFLLERIELSLSHKIIFIYNKWTAFLNIVSPFCSYSAVPLFIGLAESARLYNVLSAKNIMDYNKRERLM